MSRESLGLGAIRRNAGVILWLVLDVGIVVGSYALGLWLRFDFEGDVPAESWRQLAWAGPLIGIAYILAYQMLGVYRTAWQYGSVRDALMIAVAVAAVTVGVLAVNVMLPKRPIPLSVNVIAAAFIFLFHAMVRMLPRVWSGQLLAAHEFAGPQERVLVVGAGDTGQRLVAELQNNRVQPYRPVCFIDDDPSLHGKRIHGVPVAGNRFGIVKAIEEHRATLVALALPPDGRLQELLTLLEPVSVPVRIVPTVSDIMEGRARPGEMREITTEDLLAREPAGIDEEQCRAFVQGKVVLVTGAAGSIGSELCRRLLTFRPAALQLVDTNETGLYELWRELMQKAPEGCSVKHWLCSVTDAKRASEIFEATHPQIVMHLAARKIVPMAEDHPDDAFETNVLGTLNIFEAALSIDAEQVVFVSSHTAVNPASVYGASKRIGELLVASSPAGRTRFCAVRLTNVIDARGAVLSVFSRQIQRGGPISVTHPEVARYFLTVAEVAGLTVQAAAISRGGEVFLLDVGEELKIGELAERLARAHGTEPGVDIDVIYTGLRPGEKVRENLISEYETLESSSNSKIVRVLSSQPFSGAELRAGIRELELDLRRRPVNLPAKLHALARIDREAPVDTPSPSAAPEPQREQS